MCNPQVVFVAVQQQNRSKISPFLNFFISDIRSSGLCCNEAYSIVLKNCLKPLPRTLLLLFKTPAAAAAAMLVKIMIVKKTEKSFGKPKETRSLPPAVL
jgi:hypothetical protein